MEWMSHPVIAAVILIGALVTVHECGHFWWGAGAALQLITFSLGFGPPLFRMKTGRNDIPNSGLTTRWFRLNFYGAQRDEIIPDNVAGIGLLDASLTRRALTIAAGPAANFLLAIAVYSVMATQGLPKYLPLIGDVRANSVAANAGFDCRGIS